MNTLNCNKTGLVTGLVLGGFHLAWSVIVALGVGQAIYDFVLWAHMIHLQLTVGPFDPTASATLVVMTFVIGYVIGWAFAYCWNWFHRSL